LAIVSLVGCASGRVNRSADADSTLREQQEVVHREGGEKVGTSLAIFVHIGKTGSSSIRTALRISAQTPCKKLGGNSCTLLHTAQNHNSKITLSDDSWLCEHNRTQKINTSTCEGADVMIGGNFGDCAVIAPRRCSYFAVLRDPIDRLISEYNYFCKECKEQKKFCSKTGPNHIDGIDHMCPHMPFLTWANRHSNQYTHHFSRSWPNGAFYHSYSHEFKGLPLLKQTDLDAAVASLSAPNMLLLFLEELNQVGFPKLVASLSGTPGGEAMAKWLTNSTTLHKNRGSKNKASNYTPTTHELVVARNILALDCKLYKQLAPPKTTLPTLMGGTCL
jgi:hypothetical protein